MSGPLNLQINQETMQTLVGQAILQSITTEARDELIQTAINHLVAPTKHRDSWRNDTLPSPLEEAFKVALELYTRTAVREWIENNAEMKAVVDGKLAELLAGYREFVDDQELQARLNATVLEFVTARAKESGRW